MADIKTLWLMLFASCWIGHAYCGYLITTPWVYRLGTVQRLNVHLHGDSMMWQVTASLKNFASNKNISVTTKAIRGNSFSTINIKVPQDVTIIKGNNKIKLQVHGVSQDGKQKFKKEQQLFLENSEKKDAFFIQTEKPTYNPGETVRIRVIGLKHDLKPLEGKVRRIFISNPKGVRMAQWEDVDFKNGVANVAMPLSKQPVLGKWTIHASYKTKKTPGTLAVCPRTPSVVWECQNGGRPKPDQCKNDNQCNGQKCCENDCGRRVCVGASERPLYENKQAEKIITVKKYVLPKFKVIIEPVFVAVDSKLISGTICAQHHHGQPVSGKMKAVISTKVKEVLQVQKCPMFPRAEECPVNKENECEDDSGCAEMSVGDKKFKCCLDGCDKRCVPAIPGLTRTGNYIINTSKTVSTKIKGCYRFSFINNDLGLSRLRDNVLENEKPKFVITANITEDVTGITKSGRMDTRIKPLRIKINFNRGTARFFAPGLSFRDELSVTTIDGKPANDELVQITVKTQDNNDIFSKRYNVSNGVVNYEITKIPTSAQFLYILAKQIKSKTPNHHERPQLIAEAKKSKSGSYLALKTGSKPIKAGETAKIDLSLTTSGGEENKDFVYQLMCAGQIRVSGKTRLSSFKRISPKTADGFIAFLLPQTLAASSCRLLVYYVRQDGEVVPDSVSLKIEGKLKNQVVVDFTQKHRKPGESVQIALMAAPGSTVLLSAIDKRSKQDTEDINKAKVFSYLSSLDVGPADDLVKLATGANGVSNTFYDAGFVYLSDSPQFAIPKKTKKDSKPKAEPVRSRPLYMPWGFGNSDYGCRIWSSCYFPLYRFGRSVRETSRNRPQKGSEKTSTKSNQAQEAPETWLWTEETVSESTGERIITARVPDSITSWHLSAFAMSSTHGLGVAKPSSLTVSRPFFVSLSVPYAVVRDEKVSIVTRVFSYTNTCVTVTIKLKPTTDFQLISSNDGQRLCICGGEAKSVNHVIKPSKVGKIPLTVTVKNAAPRLSMCKDPSLEPSHGITDSETRVLRVEAEGDSQEYTYSDLICPSGKYRDEVDLDLPKDAVPGSIQATVSVTGDVMGPTLEGFEKILRLPTGCGEQNMINFAPNIYLMQYLNSTDLAVEKMMERAKDFLRKGYQQELSFKRQDGSYSAFGGRDNQGSLWLTAFVLRSFSKARQFIFIDEKEIESITKWIQSKQLRSGCFKKHGKLFFHKMKGGVSTSLTLTAYVTIALLESGLTPQSGVIANALRCIVNKQDSVRNSYSNAIIAYALTLAKHPAREKFLKRLASQAIEKDGKIHWEKESSKQQSPRGSDLPFHRSSSINIEMTGYALMAMIGDGTDRKALLRARPIVKWLSNQRNGKGGFSSTQDTSVALQALSVFGRYVNGDLVDYMKLYAGHNRPKTLMVIDVADKKGFQQNFRITHDRRLLLQRVELPGRLLPTKLQIKAVGRGCAVVQADVSYNTKTISAGPSFQISSNVRRRKDNKASPLKTETGEQLCHPLEINVCAEWREKGKSDMALIEVKLVSGFQPDEESLEKLMNNKSVGLKRFEIEDNKVVLYFNEIKDVCVTFGIAQTTVVTSMRPASVTVYDYYDTDKSASTLYEITNDLCAAEA